MRFITDLKRWYLIVHPTHTPAYTLSLCENVQATKQWQDINSPHHEYNSPDPSGQEIFLPDSRTKTKHNKLIL